MKFWEHRCNDRRENGRRNWRRGALACVAALALAVLPGPAAQAQTCISTPATQGYVDFNFGSTVYNLPTSEKPEHKLWWNDGFWWGSLWDPAVNKYRIHRFNLASQCWTSVGPDIDNRSQSLADALWDGQKLYIASHISDQTTATGNARLYRYSYDSSTDTHALDSGFPVVVNNSKSETLTLTKDTTGKLWITWVASGNVMINHSTTSDAVWATPFQLPVQGASVSADDISAIVQLKNKVGIMWSNQNDEKMYFARHLDGDPETTWQPLEIALSDVSKPVADDHVNLKLLADGSGDMYAVTKSSTNTSTDTNIYLLKRDDNGNWSSSEVSKKSEDHTRPILALDSENRMIYVFLARLAGTPRSIYRKSTSMDNIQFAPGLGDEFIRSESDLLTNNPTSTRQNVSSTTGILILASDEDSHNYLHGYMSLPNGGANQPPVANAAATPQNGAAPLPVSFSSSGSNDPDGSIASYAWNFGDGNTSTSANPAHTYNAAGTYNAVLTVTDNQGATGTASVSITVTSGSAVTFNPTNDAFVNSSIPTANYGAQTNFKIRGGTPTLVGYVKFNVTGFTGAVTSAKLRLYVVDDGTDGGSLYTVSNNYLSTSTPWLESGLNWSNAPAISGTPIVTAGAAPLNTWIEYDVISAVTGNGVFSFGLNSTSTNAVGFSSKEGANAPQLVLEGTGTGNQPPVAVASATPQSGDAPLAVTFNSAGSNDSDGSIASYSWNFGDGNTSTSANPAHTYNNAGTYNAVLTVTDNLGATGTASVTITVTNPGPLPPAAPSNLSATAVSASQINLSWTDNANDEDGFKIERKTGAAGTYAEIASLGANAISHSDNNGLLAGTNYVYRVRAYSTGGNSAYSNEANATTQGGTGSGNLALNKPAAAMTTNTTFLPNLANDGNTSTYWRSGTVSSGSPTNWWRVDLGVAQTVARTVVQWKDNYYAKIYDIQISNDDVAYSTVYTNNAGTSGTQDISFTPVAARYVRIFMRSNQKSNYRILEFEVYSSSLSKGLAGAGVEAASIPREITLEQNYPNPFRRAAASRLAGNANTQIRFALPQVSDVTVAIYSVTGQLVRQLLQREMAAGRHALTWDGRDQSGGIVAAGLYLYQLVVRGASGEIVHTQTRRMALVK